MSRPSRTLALIAATLALPTLMLAGCGGSSSGITWRTVSYRRQSLCLPVATTAEAREKGLMGVRDPLPLMFGFEPPNDRPAFWMKDTPEPLVGVWVAASNLRVLGFWHGRPYSFQPHPAPAPVSYVIEYGPKWSGRLPHLHDRISVSHACPRRDRL